MAKYLSKKAGMDFTKFKSEDGQNCLHYAVKKNQLPMANYLLSQNSTNLLNAQSLKTGESPIFLALAQKSVPHSEKMSMVRLLAEHPNMDLGLKDALGNTCYEAHADAYAYDEAANLVE